MDLFQTMAGLRADRKDFAVVTLIQTDGESPLKEGAKMVVLPDRTIYGTIGGGLLEANLIGEAVQAIERGRNRTLSYDLSGQDQDFNMICGGKVSAYIDVVLQTPTVVLAGGGHVNHAVAQIVKFLGWNYMVFDEDPAIGSRERFPDALKIGNGPFVEELNALSYDKNTYVVVATRGHANDFDCAKTVAERGAGYVGIIGSRSKVKASKARLIDSGVSSGAVAKLHMPIGLNLGHGCSAQEIAISIVAEILTVRNKASGVSMSAEITE